MANPMAVNPMQSPIITRLWWVFHNSNQPVPITEPNTDRANQGIMGYLLNEPEVMNASIKYLAGRLSGLKLMLSSSGCIAKIPKASASR